jgi:hypothetical protein
MSRTLLDHWSESLRSCGPLALQSRVLRFLLGFYGDIGREIEYPPLRTPGVSPARTLKPEVRLPKSPERIRALLVQVAKAVAAPPSAGWR